ncbi:putative pentatricopeptide repeat-containing protein At3g01580 [Chenopodium quinoa]|uniref:putative pentatricopeptide repeat-containing protein At3g01580 n=1 Tax=Chenopodium quinoa TaxID=63459 RepID=UPI000B77A5C2|nr:putative pentatricopeptide repeat-containing protein At3g01580 [Chenopodium quinoa]
MLNRKILTISISRQITAFAFHLLRFNCTHHYHHQSPSFFSSILKSVKNPRILLQLHAQIFTSGATSNHVSLSNNLMNAYISAGLISNAQKFFDQIPEKNLVSWTILISGFTKRGFFDEGVELFGKMVGSGLMPNEVTISSILPAFANLGLDLMGKSVHCFWVRRGFEHNVVVETSLIDMYCRFGRMSIARNLFDEMPVRNVVSWNVIITGYANNGMGDDALYLFNVMRKNGVSLDYFTIMSLILACSEPSRGRISSSIHGLILRIGYSKERQIQTALIDLYTRGSFIDEAYGVFNEMVVKDIVAWTLMLKAFSYCQCWSKAIILLSELMCVHYMSLDSTALVSMISSCSSSGALPQGRLIHALVVKRGFSKDVFVGSAFIGMYANCGDLGSAKNYFSWMEEKDITCWNAMIRAVGVNGNGSDAIHLLWRLEGLGLNPNESTFVSVLSACSHAGMVDEGLQIFDHMVEKRGIVPNSQHYACLVDLLGRSGRLDEAHLVISRMSLQPHSGVYGALLSSCNVYGNTEVGTEIYKQLLKLDVTDVGHLCSVSNLYSSMGDWEGTEMSHTVRRSKGIKKDPGYSLIELN